MRLADRVVVVTGGASELGQAVSIRCAEEGASVLIADRDPREGFALQSLIESEEGEASFVEVDLDDEVSIQNMVSEAIMTYGAIQGLVNCPPALPPAPRDDLPAEVWREQVEPRMRATWLTCKYSLPFLRKCDGPAVVNVFRTEGATPGRGRLMAAAVEGAGLAMTRSLAVDHGPFDIRVNAICAGFIQTPAMRRGLGEDELARLQALHPLGRAGEPVDVAHAAVFLLSPESSFVTGATLAVDGGRSVMSPDPRLS